MGSMDVFQPTTVGRSLVDLAGDINREHEAAIGHARSAVEHALRCGRMLCDAKDQLEHGEFGAWIKTNCSVKVRQAQKYMKLARNFAVECELSKSAPGAHLTVTRALELIHSDTPINPRRPETTPQSAVPLGSQGHVQHDCEQRPDRNGSIVMPSKPESTKSPETRPGAVSEDREPAKAEDHATDLESQTMGSQNVDTAEGKTRLGIRRAHEAIACLKRIPKHDQLRARALEVVADWIKHNA